jgi:hypothetical protein
VVVDVNVIVVVDRFVFQHNHWNGVRHE